MAWQPRFSKRLSDGSHMDIRRLRKMMEDHGYVVLRRWISSELLAEIRAAIGRLEDQVKEGSKSARNPATQPPIYPL